MFDKNFNIIHGDRISGRTEFLFNISREFNEVGLKLFFLSCTDIETKDRFNDIFDEYRIINTFDEVNNQKMIDVVKELSDKKKYNFLIIDDIDYLPKSCIDSLSNIDVPKIVTCLSDNCVKFSDESNFYDISDVIELSGVVEVVKGIIRNQKINSVLKNDKSR